MKQTDRLCRLMRLTINQEDVGFKESARDDSRHLFYLTYKGLTYFAHEADIDSVLGRDEPIVEYFRDLIFR